MRLELRENLVEARDPGENLVEAWERLELRESFVRGRDLGEQFVDAAPLTSRRSPWAQRCASRRFPGILNASASSDRSGRTSAGVLSSPLSLSCSRNLLSRVCIVLRLKK